MAMTTGTILFFGGIILLALTIILAVIFLIFPPKYRPENAAVGASGGIQTQPLKNNYSTGNPTHNNAPVEPAFPAPSGPETAFLDPSSPGTALLDPYSPGTALLGTPTAPLPQQIQPFERTTAELPEENEPS